MEVSHKTVYEWVQKFGDVVGKKAKRRAGTGSNWNVEETYVKVNGEWKYMYRAVDPKDNTLDLVFRQKKNLASARSFLKKQLTE
jgi:transposase-like protein